MVTLRLGIWLRALDGAALWIHHEVGKRVGFETKDRISCLVQIEVECSEGVVDLRVSHCCCCNDGLVLE